MRIDKFLAEKLGSRTKAAAAIEKGLVLVNGKPVQSSYVVKDGDDVTVNRAEEDYVSAGGFKLSKALKDFGYPIIGKIFADIGASTGGFTDCLLKNGAKKVYCIDVGESQLDKSLLSQNVVVIDNFNARGLTREVFSDKIDGVVIDVSFISLTYVLKNIADILETGGIVFALIKPQFVCEIRSVGKNGIVKDKKTHEKIIKKICGYASNVGLAPQMLTNAPIVKGKNKEFVILLEKDGNPADENKLISSVIL